MDIWEKLYRQAEKEYHPEDVSPFVQRIMSSARWRARTEGSTRVFALKHAAA